MTIRLITGRGAGSARRKTQIVYRQIYHALKAGADRCFLIVPESFTYSAERGLIEATGMRGLMGAEVMSLDRLAARVFSEAGGATAHFIDGHGRRMLLTKSILSSRDALQMYGKSVGRRGFVNDMEAFVGELRENGFTHDDLQAVLSEMPEGSLLTRKLKDTELILDAYEASLGSDRLDETDRSRLLSEKIRQANFLKDAQVWMDQFYTFSKNDFEIVGAIADRAQKLTITLPLDEDPTAADEDVFAIVRQTFADLSERTKAAGSELKMMAVDPEPSLDPELTWLEHEWFSLTPQPWEKVPEHIDLHVCSDLWDEAECAARTIIRLTRDEGYRYEDFMILVGSPETMGSEIARALAMYNIPSFVDRLEPVMNHPLVAFLFAALDAVRIHLGGDSVMAYAKTAFSGLTPEQVMALDNYAQTFGIKGWRWQKSFQKNRFRDGRNGQKDKRYLWDLDSLNQVKDRLLSPLMSLKKEMQEAGCHRERIEALVHFLEMTNIPVQLDTMAAEAMDNGDYQRAAVNNQIWNILMGVFDQINIALGEADDDFPAFIDILRSGIETYHIGVLPKQRDTVAITDALRSRSDGTKILMILGANEGILPAEQNQFPVLTDWERTRIKDAGLALQNNRAYLQNRELTVLYMQVSRVTERLYCSYSMNDADGKAIRRSSLVRALMKVFPNLEVRSSVRQDEWDLDWITGTPATINTLCLRSKDNDPVSAAVASVLDPSLSTPGFFEKSVSLSPATATTLYEKPLHLSVSRVEKFNACPFAQFVAYGLRPQPVIPYAVTAPDMGNIMHTLIERIFKWTETHDQTLDTLSAEERGALIQTFLNDLIQNTHDAVFDSSGQFRYRGRQLRRIGETTLAALSAQMAKGTFVYRDSEYFFKELLTIGGDGKAAEFRGFVDRIDSFSDGEDTFVKVIDYKSSAHDLDAAEIYYGLSLQLLIYMGIGLKVCGEKEKAALPGAAFYFKMDDPMVEGNRQNEVESLVEQINALKPQGIYLDDARVLSALDDGSDKAIQAFMKTASNKKKIRDYSRQDFEALIHFAEHHVTEGAKAILAGDIGVRPYKLGNDSSCTFCDYRGICGYDAQIDRQACRQLEKVKRETLIEKATALTTEAAEDQKEQDNAMDD